MPKKMKKQRELGGMAAAFVKSGVSDTKHASKMRTEHRREEDKSSASEKQQAHALQQEAEVQRRETEAESSRERAATEGTDADRERLLATIKEHHDPSGGRKRWFFIARDDRVPYLEVSDGSARALGDGEAGIVESLGVVAAEHVVLKGRQPLASLAARDPELIRFWNEGEH